MVSMTFQTPMKPGRITKALPVAMRIGSLPSSMSSDTPERMRTRRPRLPHAGADRAAGGVRNVAVQEARIAFDKPVRCRPALARPAQVLWSMKVRLGMV